MLEKLGEKNKFIINFQLTKKKAIFSYTEIYIYVYVEELELSSKELLKIIVLRTL